MKLWRIAAETRAYAAEDLTGRGAAKSPGRWNQAGQRVLYCAPTIAMAVLETAAHVDAGGFPLDRFLVEIQFPDADWSAREIASPSSLPGGWDAIPAGGASARFGSGWLLSQRSLLLEVPSVIVPEEAIVLINPSHAAAGRVSATTLRRFEYNRLFRGPRARG